MRASPLGHPLSLTAALILAIAAGHGTPERRPVVASPRAILLHGGSLAAPVVLQTRAATSLFLAALAPDTAGAAPDTVRGGATSRTVLVAVFWSPRPFGLPEDTLPATAFHPVHSDQQGRLYPASRGSPALLVLDPGSGFPPRRSRITARAARMLEERGIPARLLLP